MLVMVAIASGLRIGEITYPVLRLCDASFTLIVGSTGVLRVSVRADVDIIAPAEDS